MEEWYLSKYFSHPIMFDRRTELKLKSQSLEALHLSHDKYVFSSLACHSENMIPSIYTSVPLTDYGSKM